MAIVTSKWTPNRRMRFKNLGGWSLCRFSGLRLVSQVIIFGSFCGLVVWIFIVHFTLQNAYIANRKSPSFRIHKNGVHSKYTLDFGNAGYDFEAPASNKTDADVLTNLNKSTEQMENYSAATVFNVAHPPAQDDPRLIRYVLDNYLTPPRTNGSYNLDDPAAKEGQSKYVLQILESKTEGVFVESGIWEGENVSTTLMLERDYGWKGLLVDPNTENLAKVVENKGRKAWTANVCLSDTKYPKIVPLMEGLHKIALSESTLVENMNKTCIPISTLLSALNMTNVDFFRLDIEGSELKVLKTLLFDSVHIKIFCIAYFEMSDGEQRELYKFMKSKHYTLVGKTNKGDANDYILFVHKSVAIPKDVQEEIDGKSNIHVESTTT